MDISNQVSIPTSLDKLKENETAVVSGFKKGRKELVSKLLAMGVSKGAKLKLVRFAPLGDPIHIRISGLDFSLRKDEASFILVNKKI